ncbi:MAG: 5-bromo-4-chloroindolyl phosphate hydrolysis family protein [Eubacteriales bacterium]|nr:5-bromo-4-chloroindolyl phosphate hydrolysis family protein [Eubacteriales bacterium]
MQNRKDFSNIGERIQDAVQEAVSTGNFGQLSDIVNDTVGGALEEVRYQVNQAHERIRDQAEENTRRADSAAFRRSPRYPRRTDRRQDGTGWTKRGGWQTAQPYRRPDGTVAYRGAENRQRQYVSGHGTVPGVLLTVFGAIGLFFWGLALVVTAAAGAVTQTPVAGGLLFYGLLTALSGYMVGKGCGLRSRIRRAQRYAALAGQNRYLRLKELADQTGQPAGKLIRDIRSMIRSRVFVQAHMDEENGFFILDDETWRDYLEELGERRRESAGKTESAEASAEEKIEREGRAYMDRLRRLNDEIPGEVISDKLSRLDYLLGRIFAALREHPENCPQMRRFMEYYLPTTVKLVEAYAEFDRAGVQGEHVRAARAEIEKTMDTINGAFSKLLDDMYQDAAFEAAADAKVLKTVLAQDGFGQSAFEKNEKEGE